MEVKVVDQYTRVMFTAQLGDIFAHSLANDEHIKPYIKKVTPVAPGTGNGGDNLEYDVVYDGYFVAWEHFAEVGNRAN
jgi:hypothetical protein